MPSLASVSIPLSSQSPASDQDDTIKAIKSPSPESRPRTYGEAPLPFRLSDFAPKNGRISSRELHSNGVSYSVRIGEVVIHDVSVDEILYYVSAQHLEEYENQQFEEEIQLERIAEVEEERRERERQERREERAKTKGIVIRQYFDEDDERSAHRSNAEANADGRRARPTYKHLFKLPKERRRRKRNPKTGELLPLSDDELEVGMTIDRFEMNGSQKTHGRSEAALQQPKRRRRKRDPVTGELLPLSPEKGGVGVRGKEVKRKRRRRHPITGELMPIGWRWNPEAVSPAMKTLSLSQEPSSKRMKLAREAPSVISSSESLGVPSPKEQRSENHSTSSDETDDLDALDNFRSKAVPRPSGMLIRHSQQQPRDRSHSKERNTMTSILSPDARPSKHSDSGEDTGDTGDDGEWTIEAILAHHLSDPRTHPPDLGSRPVMLYQVKWEGFDDPTWEPAESFLDPGILQDYQRRVGLLRDDDEDDDMDDDSDDGDLDESI